MKSTIVDVEGGVVATVVLVVVVAVVILVEDVVVAEAVAVATFLLLYGHFSDARVTCEVPPQCLHFFFVVTVAAGFDVEGGGFVGGCCVVVGTGMHRTGGKGRIGVGDEGSTANDDDDDGFWHGILHSCASVDGSVVAHRM